jgi:hypothetical protein
MAMVVWTVNLRTRRRMVVNVLGAGLVRKKVKLSIAFWCRVGGRWHLEREACMAWRFKPKAWCVGLFHVGGQNRPWLR